MLDKLKALEERFEGITEEMARPEVVADYQRLQTLAKERASLEEVVSLYRDLRGVAAEIEEGVVDGVDLGPRVQLVAAHHDIGVGGAGGAAQLLRVLRGRQDGGVAPAHPALDPAADIRVPALGPIGIAGQPDLGEDDQLGAAGRRFLDDLAGLVERFLAVHEHRRDLRDREPPDPLPELEP